MGVTRQPRQPRQQISLNLYTWRAEWGLLSTLSTLSSGGEDE